MKTAKASSDNPHNQRNGKEKQNEKNKILEAHSKHKSFFVFSQLASSQTLRFIEFEVMKTIYILVLLAFLNFFKEPENFTEAVQI